MKTTIKEKVRPIYKIKGTPFYTIWFGAEIEGNLKWELFTDDPNVELAYNESEEDWTWYSKSEAMEQAKEWWNEHKEVI